MRYFFQALWIGFRNLAIVLVGATALAVFATVGNRYPAETFFVVGTAISVAWLVWKTYDLKRKAEKREANKLILGE